MRRHTSMAIDPSSRARPTPWAWLLSTIAGLSLVAACQSEVPAPKVTTPGAGTGTTAGTTAGVGGSGMAAGTTTGTSTSGIAMGGSAGTGTTFDPPAVDDCEGSTLAAPKRLIRLTFNQLASSIESLFGTALADEIRATYEIGSLVDRDFPPLASPREGSLFIDSVWTSSDAIAQAVGKYVFDNFATVTQCGDAPTAECAQQYLSALAEQAFRRPLNGNEQARLLQVFDEAQAAGGTIQEGVQYGTYAVMQSPHFVYRTEFGTNPAAEEQLTPFEHASAISYFLTDAPPDQELTTATASQQFSTPEQVAAQVDRMLTTPAAQANLQAAVYAYFEIPALKTVVVDPAVAPDFTEGLRASMMRETELFIDNTLFSGPLSGLLTSQTSFVNQGLADLYGIAYPPAGSTPDADGFAMATLPETRSGLLSNPGFLTARARPDTGSVVGRGLLVNATILCGTNPPFPENLADVVDQVSEMLAGASEREKADFRAGDASCASCHSFFDPYGLGLENFDVIGKYRTTDPEGRPIDPSVTLPDGTLVSSVPEMANQVVMSGAFATCMAKHLIDYALAEVSVDVSINNCATKAVMDQFNQTSQTFTDLIRTIALSNTLAVRTGGM